VNSKTLSGTKCVFPGKILSAKSVNERNIVRNSVEIQPIKRQPPKHCSDSSASVLVHIVWATGHATLQLFWNKAHFFTENKEFLCFIMQMINFFPISEPKTIWQKLVQKTIIHTCQFHFSAGYLTQKPTKKRMGYYQKQIRKFQIQSKSELYLWVCCTSCVGCSMARVQEVKKTEAVI